MPGDGLGMRREGGQLPAPGRNVGPVFISRPHGFLLLCHGPMWSWGQALCCLGPESQAGRKVIKFHWPSSRREVRGVNQLVLGRRIRCQVSPVGGVKKWRWSPRLWAVVGRPDGRRAAPRRGCWISRPVQSKMCECPQQRF